MARKLKPLSSLRQGPRHGANSQLDGRDHQALRSPCWMRDIQMITALYCMPAVPFDIDVSQAAKQKAQRARAIHLIYIPPLHLQGMTWPHPRRPKIPLSPSLSLKRFEPICKCQGQELTLIVTLPSLPAILILSRILVRRPISRLSLSSHHPVEEETRHHTSMTIRHNVWSRRLPCKHRTTHQNPNSHS